MANAVDKTLIRKYFARSLTTYDHAAGVQRAMATALAAGWRRSHYQAVLELGAGTGLLTDELTRRVAYDSLLLLDLVPECAAYHEKRPRSRFIAADLETWDYPKNTFDLVTGNAVLQWAAAPAKVFRNIFQALVPGGEFAFTTFAPGTLSELVQAGYPGLGYFTGDDLLKMLQDACFQDIEISEQFFHPHFESPLSILRHLRETGVAAPGAQAGGPMWTQARLTALGAACAVAGGGFQLTYRSIFLHMVKSRKDSVGK